MTVDRYHLVWMRDLRGPTPQKVHDDLMRFVPADRRIASQPLSWEERGMSLDELARRLPCPREGL